jgi:glutathione S-transferase
MALTLHYHPLSSYCQKVLIALYENDTPFTPMLVNLGEAASRDAFLKIWPIGKFPVLMDDDWSIPESSIIIEYLDLKYPGKTRFVPADPDAARQMRLRDRFFDFYISDTMTKIVTDRLRPEGRHDPYGVHEARERLNTALVMLDQTMAGKTWAYGEAFSMADCAAAPALFYVRRVVPSFETVYPNAAAYFGRLMKRPSFARCVREAEPYLDLFPKE